MPKALTEPNLPQLMRERLSHAYILISPHDYHEALGRQLAALMLCADKGDSACSVCRHCRKIQSGIHPDVRVITRTQDEKGRPKREIYVSQIREIGTDCIILPNEADKKVYLISEAEYMNAQAQNALLKLLEEPPRHVCFILCVENPSALMDTIRSRCVELYCASYGDQTFENAEREYLMLACEGNRLGLLRMCLSMEEFSPAELCEFLNNVRLLISAVMSGRESIPGMPTNRLFIIFTLLDRCALYLRSNVGTKQVLGVLAACTIE